MSFRLKTILGVGLIEIIMLVVLVTSSLEILNSSHDKALERHANLTAALLSEASQDAMISKDLETLARVGNELLKNPAIDKIRMTDAKGVILYDGISNDEESSTVKRVSQILFEGQYFGQIEVTFSHEFVDEVSESAQDKMVMIAGLEVFFVALFSYFLGTYLTTQLQQLRQAAKKISQGEFGAQIAISTSDEIAETSHSFNKMSLRLKKLYDEIAANEQRIKTILNTVTDGIITIDGHGIILSVNPAVTNVFGFKREEMLGRNVSMLMKDADRNSHDNDLWNYKKSDEGLSISQPRRIEGVSKTGEVISFELSVNPMELEEETLFVGTLRDLRQYEQSQEEIRRAEALLTDAIESSSDGFVLYDENDRLVICNQRYKEIYAESADLLVPGNSFEDIIRIGVERGQYVQAIGNEEEWIKSRLDVHRNPKGPVEQKLRNGHWIRVWENKTETGATIGFRIDITELKEREEALIESESRFRATIESALDCIVCVDGAGKVIEFNPAAEKCFGYTRDEVFGQEMAELIIPEEMRDMHRKGMQKFHETGEGPVLGKRIEVEALHKNGERFPVELAIEVASGADDEAIFVAYLRDITEQKTYENNLKEAKQRAEVANEAKAGFLAMMSHEIRTPLNGVLGVLGLMSETKLDEEQQKYVRTAQDSGEALLSIINDVLDFSKMEAGKMQFEISDVELQPLIASIGELLAPQAQAKGLIFDTYFDQTVPWSVRCDGGRLRQVLLNLASNAVKFTEQGGIYIHVRARPAIKGEFQLRFEVKDTGIGIPKELQSRIFGEFSTIDASYARKYGGTGLGLAITHRLIDMMGGEVGFESEEGKGSTFWIEVSFEAGSISSGVVFEQDTPAIQQIDPLRILIAEDHPTNLMITRKIVEKQGHHVLVAANGIEAIEIAQKYPLDIILMDGSMPEMDGLEATRHIRSLNGPNKDIPIIALTAHAMKGDREKFLDAGMNDYLQKPIQKEAVLNALSQWSNASLRDIEDKKVLSESKLLLDESYLIRLGEDTEPEMVPELIGIYLEDGQKRIERVHKAISENDFDVLELETHTLGSSAATYGLIPLHKLARHAESACLERNDKVALELARQLIDLAKASWIELKKFQMPEKS